MIPFTLAPKINETFQTKSNKVYIQDLHVESYKK